MPVYQIIFGISSVLVLIWLAMDMIRRAKERGELRREVYLNDLKKMADEAEGNENGETEKEE